MKEKAPERILQFMYYMILLTCCAGAFVSVLVYVSLWMGLGQAAIFIIKTITEQASIDYWSVALQIVALIVFASVLITAGGLIALLTYDAIKDQDKPSVS